MNPINLGNLPVELQREIFLKCSDKDLKQVALVSHSSHNIARERWKNSRHFTICSNIYYNKCQCTYLFPEGFSYEPSNVFSFYVIPSRGEIKFIQMQDLPRKPSDLLKTWIFGTHLGINQNRFGDRYLRYWTGLVNMSMFRGASYYQDSWTLTFNPQSSDESIQQHENCYLELRDNGREVTVTKSMQYENVEYSYKNSYNFEKKCYINNRDNSKIEISNQKDLVLSTKRPIEGFEILGSFIFLLVDGKIQIFERLSLKYIRTLDSKFKCFALQANREEGILFVLTSHGLEIHNFSQDQNLISPKIPPFAKIVSKINQFTKVFFITFRKMITNPSHLIRYIGDVHPISIGVALTCLWHSPGGIIVKTMLLFFALILHHPIKNFSRSIK